MPPLRLDIVSDIVCPWCWLGLRRLEAARALVPDIAIAVTWRPFQLDPSVPREGLDYRAYMRAKFSGEGEGRFAAMRAQLEAAAPASGIRFRFDAIARRPNTADAHRVVRWAQGQGRGTQAKEALFRAFFDEGRDIGNQAVLADIASAVGLDRALVAALLAEDRDMAELAAEEEFFRRLGVRAVPTFISEGRLALSGAYEPEPLAEFLREAAAERGGEAP